MKTIKLTFVSLFCALFVVGCTSLDTVPEGGTMTDGQKEDVLNGNSAMFQSEINGLYTGLYKYGSITTWYGSTRHFDFGYAAACMMFDASGQDSPSEDNGYNWFRTSMRYTDRTLSSDVGYFLWNLFYSHMKTANDILAVITADKATTDMLKAYRGQALASRAFDYLNLVQMYQFTYKGHENDPAVPIVTEATTAEEARNNPRATVAEVYKLINDDLTEAIALLANFNRSGKEAINKNVAYGLRARANLNMEKWAEAADDAQKAMTGFTPYSITEVSKPTFNKISASSWIWGIAVSETADIVQSGILNFPSMMCSFTGNGYAPGYAGRYINDNLWNQIPESDVRKGWWIDEGYDSPLVDWTWKIEYQGNYYDIADWEGWNAPYLNVKFGPYQDTYDNSTNACDFPLMRAEEMALIYAEATAMGGNPAAAKTYLETFVRTYRNPSYTCPASDAAGIQNEVWLQRRVELWGEGFSLFDAKRLKKTINRKDSNYPGATLYNLPAEAPILLWIIPESESNQNKGIVNNALVAAPLPN